ncbi:MAG: hypothetical protein J6P87_03955 [Lachnospiraceae bacterium]|nr:hypothetical protein [Lachnospiraceae bacterium]
MNAFKKYILPALCLLVILLVTVFPYFKDGLYGYAPDYLYHLNRIEGVRDALRTGTYPAAVYPHFYYGQGYGSALFYPDIFLLIPAVLGLLGMPAVTALKVFMSLICLLAGASSYLCFRYVAGDRKTALTGTFLLMLSQFYLADLIVRSGFSGYMCYIFLPLWAAGLYDFFVREGRKTWLIGAGLTGMVLCHTINTFLALFITVLVFVFSLFFRKGRAALTDAARMKRLVITAAACVLLSAFYTFPLFEQMTSGVDFTYSHPWAFVGEFVQPFENFFLPTGYFFNIAYVGIGVPVLMMAAARVFAGNRASKSGRAFYYAGILLLLSMTRIVPWKSLEKTVFNQLQFTFRIYPFALVFLIMGICLLIRDMQDEKVRTGCVVFAAVLSVVFGIWQNMTVMPNEFWVIDRETIREYSDLSGKGEWLPYAYDPEMGKALSALDPFVYYENEPELFLPYSRSAAVAGGTFEKPETADAVNIIVPQIYYKGYSAKDGDGTSYSVSCADNGLTRVESVKNGGVITVRYRRTAVQILSMILSALTAAALIAYAAVHCKRKQKTPET